ncbi:hypothetical protein VPNG_09452 [Cytospora leucostoma]|uniref:Peptidase A1 domain-containing protein n=1 Tax=Cytospora leucostoma TaxID=1230097 RepID=A0A423VPU5_9PEZI|nr:hypothetical protein VPNG_09452 [Cytospora leucostoma]
MMNSVLEKLLAVAIIALCLASARPTTTSLQPLTDDARDAALLPLPGVEFRRVTHRNIKREARDRFQSTEKYAELHSYRSELSGQQSATRRLGAARRRFGGPGYENITAANPYGTQYGVSVTFGDQPLLLDLDTGSGDTWALYDRTNCTTGTGRVIADGFCRFGPRYAGNFTYGAIKDEHLFIQYGDGEIVEGPLGYMDVTVGGIRVRNQTVGLANETFWHGNSVSSGVLGLAYPVLTNAYYGPRGQEDWWWAAQYSPVFSTMVGQGLVDSFFSVAINRPGGNLSAGVIGFGGVPGDVVGVDYDIAAQADIIVADVANVVSETSDYSFYTIIPDGWYFGSSTDDKKYPYIIDTGTSLIHLPIGKSMNILDPIHTPFPVLLPPFLTNPLAGAINNMFSPPAAFSLEHDGYLTTCDALAPRVAVVVDGTPFYLSPEDLIFRTVPDGLTGLCMTAIKGGPHGPFVLGDAFLKNVLAVFDIGDNVVQLASRVRY